jgi:hypothetical protein
MWPKESAFAMRQPPTRQNRYVVGLAEQDASVRVGTFDNNSSL